MSLRIRVVGVTEEATTFFAALAWPDGVPPPRVDLVTVQAQGEGEARLFARFARWPDPLAPAEFAPVVPSAWDFIARLSDAAEAWCRRFGGAPGAYPDGIRGQIVRGLTIRQAGAWIYSAQLAEALSGGARSG